MNIQVLFKIIQAQLLLKDKTVIIHFPFFFPGHPIVCKNLEDSCSFNDLENLTP